MTAKWPLRAVRVALRGGGDLGSGVAYRLHRAGFPVLILELPAPLLVRRTVAYGSAVVEGTITVDGITARRVSSVSEALQVQGAGEIAVLADPQMESVTEYNPAVVIDARMCKIPPESLPFKPTLLIGLGPGFTASVDCDVVIETNRGHHLGRVIEQGQAEADTGVPGSMQGRTVSRVLRAPTSGHVQALESIGTMLQEGQPVAHIGEHVLTAPFAGVLRGLIHEQVLAKAGEKVGDVDPRADPSYCFTISEKSLAIGGGVLEAVLASAAIREIILSSI